MGYNLNDVYEGFFFDVWKETVEWVRVHAGQLFLIGGFCHLEKNPKYDEIFIIKRSESQKFPYFFF